MGKNKPRAKKDNGDNWVSVLLEPLQGKSDEDVLEWLRTRDVSDAEVLAPRFISATIPENLLNAAKQQANVSLKTTKQVR
jgi:glutaredoxin 2